MPATRALIHVSNLRHNIAAIRGALAPGAALCAMVKADAYGHGAVMVSRACVEAGAACLGVAGVEEGRELRDAGITVPILVVRNVLPEEAEGAVAAGLDVLVVDARGIAALEAAAARVGRRVAAHLKIDTGMGRLGCRPGEAAELARRLASSPRLRLAGVCTHFAGADMPDRAYTERQIEVFARCLEEIRSLGIDPGIVHASNTGGLLGFPQAHFDMVRVGIALYGYAGGSSPAPAAGLRPVMELTTRVGFVKEVEAGAAISYGMTWRAPRRTRIATLAVGYGDGYSRSLSNRAVVWVGGRRCPVVGRICMDQCMVDLGPLSEVRAGDPVTLFGPRGPWAAPADGPPDAAEIADLMGTIPYEVTCLVTRRVPRIAVD